MLEVKNHKSKDEKVMTGEEKNVSKVGGDEVERLAFGRRRDNYKYRAEEQETEMGIRSLKLKKLPSLSLFEEVGG